MKSRYLLGVSAVALVVAMTPVRADEILSSDPDGVVIDFPVNGNVINPLGSTLGTAIDPPGTGLQIDDTVTKDVINNGTIFAEGVGISDDAGYVGGAIVNNQLIDVNNDDTEDGSATGIWQYSDGDGSRNLTARNAGTILVNVDAEDFDEDDSADATADAYGIAQEIRTYESGNGSVSAENSGLIEVTASAEARGGTDGDDYDGQADASAWAVGIDQEVYIIDGNAGATATNKLGGTILATANASAFGGGTQDGSAEADASAVGINQDVYAEFGSANGAVTNAGTIVATATADGWGADDVGDDGYGYASVSVTGIDQYVSGDTGTGSVVNSGAIVVSGTANAYGGDDAGYGYAAASAENYGVYQYVNGDDGFGLAEGTNAGTISVTATAKAYGGDDPGDDDEETVASAEAEGWTQDVDGYDTVTARTTNAGTITATAKAVATGGRTTDEGINLDVESWANAEGINQNVEVYGGGIARADATNGIGNEISVAAEATATAFDFGDASASASATGIDQWIDGDGYYADMAIARATNDGTIAVSAKAKATGGDELSSELLDSNGSDEGGEYTAYYNPTATATAQAFGIKQVTYDAYTVDLAATNTGEIYVKATAEAEGFGAYVGDEEDDAYLDEGEFDYLVDGVAAVGIFQHADDQWTQEGSGPYTLGDATLSATNTNRIDVSAEADAYATGMDYDNEAYAGALGVGILQSIEDANVGQATADNSGLIKVNSYAEAEADGTNNYAWAEASGYGILQDVVGYTDAFGDATNTGSIVVDVGAEARGNDDLHSNAYGAGIAQYMEADAPLTARATAVNDGDIGVEVHAEVTREASNTNADVDVYAGAAGIDQWGRGPGNVSLSATNTSDGEIVVAAYGYANIGDSDAREAGSGSALAEAWGIWQSAEDSIGYDADSSEYTGLTLNALNDGYIAAYAFAGAEGAYATHTDEGEPPETITDENAGAYANALAIGISQFVDASYNPWNQSSITNTGAIFVSAEADVDDDNDYSNDGSIFGGANAAAIGTLQDGADDGAEQYDFAWRNSGIIVAGAQAYGYGAENRALAIGAQAGHEVAYGPDGIDDGTADDIIGGLIGQTINLDYVNENTGMIWAYADADALGDASATALGMDFEADRITGSVTNDGLVFALAQADAGGLSFNQAIGVAFSGDVIDGSFTNRGAIVALADGTADIEESTGLLIGTYEDYDTGYELGIDEDDVDDAKFTVTNNGGVIIAGFGNLGDGNLGQGFQGGFSFTGLEDGITLGNAINIRHDPDDDLFGYQEIDVQLKGEENDGFIIGNVVYNNWEQDFTVSAGKTQFLGQWSSDDAGEGEGDYTGNLRVADGGTFHLLNRDDQYTLNGIVPLADSVGNAMVYVDDFTVEEGGTFSVGLGPNDGTPFFGHVFANNADVEDGTLKAHFIAAYYGTSFDERNYEDVLVADNNFGTFANIVSNTPLMQVWDEYDGTYTADIVAQRVAFDQVDGLTENQRQVAAAIEDRYGDHEDVEYNEMNDYEQMIARLFALDGEQNYKDALDMFSAEPYAATMSSMLWSFGPLQWILADRLGGGAGGTGGEPLGYAEDTTANSPANDAIITGSLPTYERASLWVRPFGSWGDQKDGSSIALAHTQTQYGIYGGGDVNVGNATLGMAAGYLSTGLNFNDGSSTDYSGFQIAGYGKVDMGALYLRGVAAGGFYENKGTRLYDGGTETANAEYGSRAGSVYGEVGFNGLAMANMSLTPFAGAGYTFGSSDAFTETGTGPGNVSVDAASGSNVITSLGAQWNANGMIGDKPVRTSVRVAWEHRFGDGFAGLNANFANPNAPIGIGFTSTAGNWANDFAVVGASGTVDLTPATEFTLRYDGRFSADFLSNTVSGTLRQKF